MESGFDFWRRRVGLVLGPALAGLIWWSSFPALSQEAHRLAAIVSCVVVWWICEPIPMPMTALLGTTSAVIVGVAPAKVAFAPFAEPLMFLFIGSFMLARAIFLHGLDRRLAHGVLRQKWVGANRWRVLVMFGVVTAVLSGWMSNTATTAMMFAIGISLLRVLSDESAAAENSGSANLGKPARYATCLMLMTTFAATIGGLATPVGTPPNVIGLGFLREELQLEISFFEWMVVGVPIVVTMMAALCGYFWLLLRSELRTVATHSAEAARRLARESPGAWSNGERSTVIAFAATALLWVLPGVVALALGEDHAWYALLRESIPEAVVALLGAGLLFFLPGNLDGRAMNWEQAARIDWGILLLYGGGLALGTLADKTQLATVVGQAVAGHLPADSTLVLLVAATVVATAVSELTSNTASVTIVVPLAIAIARQAGADPLLPALGATFAASLGFMLPVSTPCNAIVYSSGKIPLGRMVAYGAALDVVGVATIVAVVYSLGGWLR